MTHKPFISRPHLYEENIQDGLELKVRAALLSSPKGQQEPGIIIFYGRLIKYVIPADQGLRIANEIADAVEDAERAAA